MKCGATWPPFQLLLAPICSHRSFADTCPKDVLQQATSKRRKAAQVALRTVDGTKHTELAAPAAAKSSPKRSTDGHGDTLLMAHVAIGFDNPR